MIERSEYRPLHPQEAFVVPLLKTEIERMLLLYAAGRSPGRALDVGCGRHPFRGAVEGLGYSYTGMDVQQNAEGTVDLVHAIDAPLPEAIVGGPGFDLVLCLEVLEHVEEWEQTFSNLHSLMAQGGRLLVTCPHIYQLHEEPYDFWRPTLHALRRFGETAGLTVLEERRVGGPWDVLGTVLAGSWPLATSTGFVPRAAARLTDALRRRLVTALQGGRIQRLVDLTGPLYLSNAVVFERLS